MMPAAEAEHRAEQTTLLSGMVHQRWTDAAFVGRSRNWPPDRWPPTRTSDAAVTIRRLKRQVDKKLKLPQSLVEELARTAVLGQQRLGAGPAGERFRPLPALAGKDVRAEAAAGRGPGLSSSRPTTPCWTTTSRRS